MVQMRGSMVIAVALEGAAVMGEFGPGSLVGVMKLRRYFQIYRVLVPE